uniref:Uncharacterized protein TCIL3000_5_110 n=1 Tax=Trypanosoma congolense (strain IL3000) TaxID=1068625 RepID=G0UMC2_TRYCI|nr:unnamed protein product [Trypanosoma congolense IL3000]
MRFLCWFACSPTLRAFCVAEIRAAADALGEVIEFLECPPWLLADSTQSLFCVIEATSVEAARHIAGRCVLVRAVYRLIAAAATVDELLFVCSVQQRRSVALRGINGDVSGVNTVDTACGSEEAEAKRWLHGAPYRVVLRQHQKTSLQRVERVLDPEDRVEHDPTADACYSNASDAVKADDDHNVGGSVAVAVRVEAVGRHCPVEEKDALASRVADALGVSRRKAATDASSRGKNGSVCSDDAEERNGEGGEEELPCSDVYLFLEHAAENAPPGAPPTWSPSGPVRRAFCGILVATSARQHILSRYSLQRRPYIGTTSMPPEPAFVMAHLACVRRGGLIFDPFAGTCGILVAAAHYGAMTFAGDVDGRAMQRGTQRGLRSAQQRQQRSMAVKMIGESTLQRLGIPLEEALERPSVRTNFQLYGFAPPERVRMNFAKWDELLRSDRRMATKEGNSDGTVLASANGRVDVGTIDGGVASGHARGGFLDAIVTDPPYGIRERRETAVVKPLTPDATRVDAEGTNNIADLNASIGSRTATGSADAGVLADASSRPSKAPVVASYSVSDIVLDLMLFAAEALVVGGRLVLWYPSSSTGYCDDELPFHPSLQLLHNIPQQVSLKIVRRLLVFVKSQPAPAVRLTRESCMGSREAQNLRQLMDQTDLPENEAYTHYREKLMRKRVASQRFHSMRMEAGENCRDEPDSNAHQEGERRSPNSSRAALPQLCEEPERNALDAGGVQRRHMTKRERQEFIVSNREKKLSG